MTAGGYPFAGPVDVHPEPTRCSFVVAQVRIGGQSGVVVQFATPIGVMQFFMPNEAAIKLSDELRDKASGIIIANGALAPHPASS